MPLNDELLKRRRILLGFSQADLAIIAGVSEITVGRLERKQAPDGGGNTSIDVVMRLCAALQLELEEVAIAPVGNRYETAVRFAHQEQSPLAAPKLHDRSRTIKAQGFRRMTGQRTALDELMIARVEEEEPAPDHGTPGVFGPEETHRHTEEQLKSIDGWDFADGSSE